MLTIYGAKESRARKQCLKSLREGRTYAGVDRKSGSGIVCLEGTSSRDGSLSIGSRGGAVPWTTTARANKAADFSWLYSVVYAVVDASTAISPVQIGPVRIGIEDMTS